MMQPPPLWFCDDTAPEAVIAVSPNDFIE